MSRRFTPMLIGKFMAFLLAGSTQPRTKQKGHNGVGETNENGVQTNKKGREKRKKSIQLWS